jgi:hypothetical protein
LAGNWCFCDEFCKLPQKNALKFWESLYKLSKQGTFITVSKVITTGFSSMMTGIVVFSMLVIGVVEWSRAAVPVSGGSSGSQNTGSGSQNTGSGSQNTGAAKTTVQSNAAGQGQSQSFIQSQSNAKTQTQQTTKKTVQTSTIKSKAKVTVRNTINAAQRVNRARSVVSSSRRPAIVRTRVSPNVGRSMRLTLRMRQPVTRFTGGGSSPAINAHAHSRFERGTKKTKEGRGN